MGSLIPHARAIGALVIAMVEPSFRRLAMAPPRARDRSAAREPATGRRAVRVPAIARHTSVQDLMLEAIAIVLKGPGAVFKP